jgi:hypothetical protein
MVCPAQGHFWIKFNLALHPVYVNKKTELHPGKII